MAPHRRPTIARPLPFGSPIQEVSAIGLPRTPCSASAFEVLVTIARSGFHCSMWCRLLRKQPLQFQRRFERRQPVYPEIS